MMVEWHVTPDYIVNNWTDELLDLMIEKFNERMRGAMKPEMASGTDEQNVPEAVLFNQAKNVIKVVKE